MDAFVNIVLNATSWDQLGLERDKTGLRKAQVRVHPDVCKHPQANLAFTKLKSLFHAPDVSLRLAAGRFGGGSIYWSFDALNSDLLDRAEKAQNALWKSSEPVQWVPEPHRNKLTLESRYGPGWWLLSAFKELDERTIAWIWRRLLTVIHLAEREGWVHGDINANTVALLPSEHGLRLDGWWTAVPFGASLEVSPYAFTLPRYLSGNPTDTELSVSQSAALLLESGKTSPALGKFLYEMRLRPIPVEKAVHRGEAALKKDFGGSKWHPLPAPPSKSI